MKTSTLKFALFISLLFNATMLATAAWHFSGHGAYWQTPFGASIRKDRFLFEELSMKPEQMRAMRAKALPFRAEIDKKRREIAARQGRLLALLRGGAVNNTAIDAAIKEISERQEEMQRMITAHILEMKMMLDKEQQEKFLDLISRAMQGGGKGWPGR